MIEHLDHALPPETDPSGGPALDAADDLVGDDPTTWWDVSEAATHLNVTAHTLRYYERIGMVSVPRDDAGHRRYDSPAIRRLV
ncbi:MerR family DNA-binding transcriptional regulator, partial [Micrococcus sp. SIMBA_144]